MGPRACHCLSQLSRERVESCLSVYPNPAGSVEERGAPTKPALPTPSPTLISQLQVLGGTKMAWGSGNYWGSR